MKRVLVVGGAGFIGSHVVDKLASQDYEIYVIDNFSSGNLENLQHIDYKKLNIITCDITDKTVQNLILNIAPDIILLLAAQPSVIVSIKDPGLDAKVNILGLVNILEGARKSNCDKVVFASSGGTIYGNPDKNSLPIKEDCQKHASSFYGLTKLTASYYFELYKNLYNVNYVALALGNVYGPRQSPDGDAGVISIFAKKILTNNQCIINGDGHTTRDYVYVSDVAEAFVKAMDNGNGLINIGSGIETSVNKIYQNLIYTINVPNNYKHGKELKGEVRRISLDIQKAKRELYWIPKVNLKLGIMKTVEWIKCQI